MGLPNEQCVTVTNLDDSCLVVGSSCGKSYGTIAASYIPSDERLNSELPVKLMD